MGKQVEADPAPRFVSRLGQWLLWVTVSAVLAVTGLMRVFARPSPAKSGARLAIESGFRGWELIEYEEIHLSACEYLGAERVHRVVAEDRARYARDMRTFVRAFRPTHYFYDPRTGSQAKLRGLWHALRTAILFRWYGVTPIAWLTDLPVRAWRRQCLVVTARSGIIVTLMSPQRMASFVPHGRLMGPSLMAISCSRLGELQAGRQNRQVAPPSAVFTGSMYEPRVTILNEIRERLVRQGLELEMLVRPLNGERVPNTEYWERLFRSDILVTTADQVAGAGIDDVGLPHLIYRYSEALAAGALLVAPEVPGMRRYLVPGVHFVSYSTSADAADRIAYYLDHDEEREVIALSGATRMAELIRSHAYWVAIDSALGKQSMTQ